ncbi:MAG: CRISPR-associated endonuclease Cas3'', partial [Desulfobacterales bacterium]|nr:CRISPR-associated endonuclease Cas3'' [Desulfobacterales bacterium]
MNELKSHPQILLKEHIAQVKMAAEGIYQWHSEQLISKEVKKLSEMLAVLHDVGKSSAAFQEYIVNPSAYKGESLGKAHSPLSLLFILLISQKNEWTELDTLILAACAYGHHSALPYLPPENFTDEISDHTLDNYATGTIAKILKKQILSIDLSLVKKATNIQFSQPYLSSKCINESEKYLQKIMPKFYSMTNDSIDESIDFRLKTQLIFSILLEADKAFLSVPDPKFHLERKHRKWKSEWIKQKI